MGVGCFTTYIRFLSVACKQHYLIVFARKQMPYLPMRGHLLMSRENVFLVQGVNIVLARAISSSCTAPTFRMSFPCKHSCLAPDDIIVAWGKKSDCAGGASFCSMAWCGMPCYGIAHAILEWATYVSLNKAKHANMLARIRWPRFRGSFGPKNK